jgi:glutathione synthase/RimK-type ligase-like ATP-grasp enzyme
MPEFDVTLLTDSRYINPTSQTKYVRNILNEDAILQKALEAKGMKVTRKDWADPAFDWATTRAALFHTTWDYFDRFYEFNRWLTQVSQDTTLINSSNIINWNIDKHYLSGLSKKGVHTVPTRFIPHGSGISLAEHINMTGWRHAVIKPTVGGAGRHTHRISEANLAEVAQYLTPVMNSEDFMLQPFQYSIESEGELSLMVFGNEYSHAVLKKAKKGDFRVQDDFGGTVHHHTASDTEIEFALNAVAACPELPAYARVDIIRDNDGDLAVSELELVEPEMWFRLRPEAAELLAGEVGRRI